MKTLFKAEVKYFEASIVLEKSVKENLDKLINKLKSNKIYRRWLKLRSYSMNKM